ncbi:MAG: hypothetical protein NTW59_03205, partial [Candidatus Diapherotrites archaeon]|nr:hypothetical protein [Candidatus Diapherotrites archaeon]
NEIIADIVYLVSAFVFAWVIYTALGIALGTASPMIIVLSGSMEPLYHRGDVLVLQGATPENLAGQEVELPGTALRGAPLSDFATPVYSTESGSVQIQKIQFGNGKETEITKEGSVVVYFSGWRQQPIVHRVVAKLHAPDGWFVLTKGDSALNNTVDQDCGRIINGLPERNCITLYPVPVQELQGKAIAWLPAVGCFKLWIFDDIGSLLAKGKLPEDFSGIC